MSRLVLWAVTLVALGALAACGDEDGAGAGRTNSDPFVEVSRQPSQTRAARRAAPRWARVARLTGRAPATHAVPIARGAIQWRVRWRCSSGRLTLAVTPQPRSSPERSGGRCPGSGEATWVQTGAQRLRVDARGSWRVIVEQQIDTPIDEPVLAAMRAPGARLLKRAAFYSVERQGRGRALLYRLADGRGALRLENFRTSTNTDLFVWLSTARRPRTTKQVTRARRIGDLRPLKSTEGAQNYLLPPGLDLSRIRSVAIWCVPIQIVYTAAAY